MDETNGGGRTATQTIEVFTAGCSCCEEALETVRRIACSSCAVKIRDMNEPSGQERARRLGVRSVPAVAVDGVLANCCVGRGVEETALQSAGVGQPK